MKILAIDSSGLTASVAVVEEGRVICEYSMNDKKTHSQTLLPMIDAMKSLIGLDLESLDAIAVASGPGSFTGLRIGSATAKGLGLALNKPIVPVPTLEGMAYQLNCHASYICPIMDARRNQVYTGLYRGEHIENGFEAILDSFETVIEPMAIEIDGLIEKLNAFGRPVVFQGDGVPVFQAVIREKLDVPFSFAPAFADRQRAAALGMRAIERMKAGLIEDARDHQPDYLRVSQAERERAQMQKESSLTVRTMELKDAATVCEIEFQSFPDPWSEQSVLDTMNNKQALCLSVEKHGKVIGYVLAYLAADEIEIARIAVISEERRTGAASAIFEEMIQYAKDNHYQKILIDVRQSNTPALAFYKKQGMVIDGVRKHFYTSPDESAILMSRTIEP